MPYVDEPFQHDVFLSYSHGTDSQGRPGVLKAWSQGFHRELVNELKYHKDFTQTVDVFMDDSPERGRGLDRMSPLAQQLEQHARHSALLLVLMSPHYQGSPWCKAEREWWWQGHVANGLVPEGRVALVRIAPEAAWPKGRPCELVDNRGELLPGYFFYSPLGSVDARPLGWIEGPEELRRNPELRAQLLNLVSDLRVKLEMVKADAVRLRKQREANEKLREVGGQALYLHGRPDHRREWDTLSEQLQNAGYEVFPGEPDKLASDPAEIDKIRTSRVKQLAGCDALLLVGTDNGHAIDEDLLTVGKHDRHSARALSNRLLPCALLDTTGQQVSTPVRRRNAVLLKADWLDAARPPVAPLVQQWLHQRAGAAP